MANRELDISHSLALLENVNKAANIGIFQYEVETENIYWNEVLRRIYEVPEDFEPNLENVFDFIQLPGLKEQIENVHLGAIEFGKSFEIEHAIITGKGNSRFTRTIGQPIFENGICVYVHGAVLDITKQKNAEAELAKQNQQLALTGKMAQIGYWRWDTKKNKETWSNQLYEIFEIENSKEITYETYLTFIHPDDIEYVTKKIDDAFINKILPPFSHRIILKNGTIKVILAAGQLIINEKGEVIEMLGTCQDITEDKVNEQNRQLLEISERLTLAGSWQWNPTNQKFKWSDNLYGIVGLEKEKKITIDSYLNITHPDDIALVKAKTNEIIENKKSIIFTHRILLIDGNQKVLEIKAEPILNKKGEIEVIIGSTQDITQKVNIENDLREKNQLLDFAEKLTTIGYWKYIPESNTVFWSDNHYEIFEHPKDEKLTFESYFNRIHPDDQDFVSKKVKQSIKDLKFNDFTHRIILKSGVIKTLQVIGKVYKKDPDGPVELIGTCLDITESETRGLELAQKNQQLRIAERMTMTGSWQWNPITNVVIWSDNMYNIYEHDINVPISYETYLNYVHEDDKKDVSAKLKAGMHDGKFREATYRIRLKDGTIKTLKSIGKIITNKRGEVVEMLGTCQDITESTKNELKLIQKNKELNFAEKLAKSGSWSYEILTGEILWSDNLHDIFGFKKDTIVTFQLFTDLIHKDDKELVVAKFNSSINFSQPYESTYRIVLKNGTTKIVKSVGEIIANEKGEVIKMLGSCQDITKSIKAKQEIEHKNKQLNFAEQMASLGSWEYNPSTEDFIWSDNLYRIYGFEPGIEMNLELGISRVHPEDLEATRNIVREILHGVDHESFIQRIILDDGTIKTVEARANTITDKEGNLKLVGTTQDITESKKKEQLIIYKNQQLNLAEKTAMLGSWEWQPQLNIYKWSENLYRIYGWEPGIEISHELTLTRIHPEDMPKVTQYVNEILDGAVPKKFIHRIILDNGDVRTLEIRGNASKDKEGNITLVGTTQDISEAKKNEEAILQKNQQLNDAEQIAMSGSWSWHANTNTYKWSNNLYKIYDIEVGSPIDFKKFLTRVHPEDQENISKIQKEFVQTKVINNIHRAKHKNGKVRTIEAVGRLITNDKGEIIEAIGSSQDITERLQKEQEILENNRQFNFAEKIALIGSWQWDVLENKIKWSDNLYRIFGIEIGTPIDIELFYSRIHKDDYNAVKSKEKQIFEEKEYDNSEYRIQLPNGDVKNLEVFGDIITDDVGNIIKISGTTQDITARVKSQQETLEKKQLLESAEKMSDIGSWSLNLKNDQLSWSDHLYNIFELPSEEKITRNIWFSFVHPDDKVRVISQVENRLKKNAIKEITYRIVTKNSTKKTLKAVSEIVKDNKNNPISIIGTVQDITESIKKEYKLIQTNSQLNKAEELAMIGSFIFNPKTQEFNWSHNSYRIYGFEVGIPMSFKKFLTCIHSDDYDKLVNHLKELLEFKVFNTIIYKVKHKHGVIRTIEAKGKVILDDTGEILEILGTSMDITEQKKAESKILETNNRLENITTELMSRNRQLADFNQITSHNLRGPVSNLSSLLELHNESTDEDLKALLFSKFGVVIDHLTLTLNTLIDSLKIKNNENLVKLELSFDDTLVKTKEILVADILKTDAVIISDFASTPTILYNEIYLESIFLNLISNAIKYKSPNRNPEITISTTIKNGKTMLTIQDNGLGIDLEKHGDKLFGLNKVFHRHPEALGIGLFLTKAQIEAMGGSIYAESEVNVGTTFFITLN
ncbi:PAS domain-containing protein [Aurantibacter sp.]|uniref:PAS domain-containing sensor histidine kinase n=1 Tax=Aurantibacter sp. TaxID=2807103 RepID=UPI0032664169